MRLTLVTDAWQPQVNGVVTTLRQTVLALEARDIEVDLVTPSGHWTVPCPSYPEIRLAVAAGGAVRRRLLEHAPDAVHIATEGPLGSTARKLCLSWGWKFTTSYHTRFPEYLRARWPIPEAWSYAWLRRFHGAAARTMVGTPMLCRELQARGFTGLVEWSRGVDTEMFRPTPRHELLPWGAARGPRPLLIHVGRVAVEKNIEAFLRLPIEADKVVVGDGPARNVLQQRYPGVHWTGYLHGEALASLLAQADCLVFPSRTDTFGLVMLEAMACGVPVAAYPVTGPVDVVLPGVTGELHEDLGSAVQRALRLDRIAVREAVLSRGWAGSSAQFLANLVPTRERSRSRMRGSLPRPTVPRNCHRAPV
jgi:glycosyltransferase involved in cell wall biosynthesis